MSPFSLQLVATTEEMASAFRIRFVEHPAVQIVLVAFVLAELALSISLGPARIILIFGSGLLTVASAGAYLVSWLRHMSGYGAGKSV